MKKVERRQPSTKVERRRFLRVLAGVGLLGCGGTKGGTGPPAPSCGSAGLGPGLSYCLVSKDEIVLPGMAHLDIGEVALMALDDNSAAIVARDEQGFYGLSATCPHACCTVTICTDANCTSPLVSPADCAPPVRGALTPSGAAFFCPCHGSQFAADGGILKGPARSSLPSVAVRLRGEDVIVDLSSDVPATTRVLPA